MAASRARCRRRSWPPTATSSSVCSGSRWAATRERRRTRRRTRSRWSRRTRSRSTRSGARATKPPRPQRTHPLPKGERAGGGGGPVRGFTRWNAADPRSTPRDRLLDARADPGAPVPSFDETAATLAESRPNGRAMEFPVAAPAAPAAYLAGTFDPKGRDRFFLRNGLDKLGLRTVTVDLATSG